MNQHSGIAALALLVVASSGASTVAQQSPSSQQQAAVTQASQDEQETVGEISEYVAQVRFQKLGYGNIGAWTRNGDYLEATATKDGKSYQLRLHVLTGTRDEKPAPTLK